MPRKYLTKFDDNGKQCNRSIQHLRNHPECGVLFYDDKPFNPKPTPIPPRPPTPGPKPIPPTPGPKPIPPTPGPTPPTPGPTPPTPPTPGPPPPLPPAPTPTPSPSPFTPLILPQDYTNQQIPYVVGSGLIGDRAMPHIDNLIEKANQNLTMPKLKGYRKLSENEAPKPIMTEIEMQSTRPTVTDEFPLLQEKTINELGENIPLPLEPEVNITDLPPDVKEYILQESTGLVDDTKITLDLDEIRSLEAYYSRKAEDQEIDEASRFRNRMNAERMGKLGNDLQRRVDSKTRLRNILAGEADQPKPRGGMTDEELINEQQRRLFEEITERQAYEDATRELKKSELNKDKLFSQDEGFELTAIKPLDEFTAVSEEVTRLVGGKSKQGLTTSQKDIIVQRMTDKNISPARTEQILRDAKLYEEVGGVSQEEENLARDVRRNLQRGEGSSTDPIDSDLVPDDKLISDMQTLLPRKVTVDPKPTIMERAKRVFAQPEYSKVPLAELEMQDTKPKIIEETETITEEGEARPTRSSFLQRASKNTYNPIEHEFETEPITEPTSISSSRSYRPSLGTTARAGATGAVGVAGGYGTVRGLQEMGVTNRWALAAAGGVGGDMSTRILAMAGSSALRSGTSSAAMVASRTATTAITAGLRGAATGGLIGAAAGIALMPLGDYFAHQFARTNMSITEQSTATAATTGAVGAGLMTAGLFAFGAAPETLGFSAIAGVASIAAGTAIGFFEGRSAERDARRAREQQRDQTNATTAARARLIATLPQHNYNIDEAWSAFALNDDRASLRENEQSFSDLIRSQAAMYGRTSAIPNLRPPTQPAAPTPESENLNDIYSRYVRYQVAQQACAGGQDCGDLANATMPTAFELAHINGQTNSTWQSQADLQVQSIMHQSTFHREQIATAQRQLYSAWNFPNQQLGGRRTINMLSKSPAYQRVIDLANQDPNFMETYNQAIRRDAQQQIVDAFRTGQRIDKMPAVIRETALLDPEFGTEINNYYNYIESSARNSGITPEQFQSLQDIEDDTERQAALQRMAVTGRFQERERKATQAGVSKQIKLIDVEAAKQIPANRRNLISGGREDLLHYHSNDLYAQTAIDDDVDPHHIYELDDEEREQNEELEAIETERLGGEEQAQIQQEAVEETKQKEESQASEATPAF